MKTKILLMIMTALLLTWSLSTSINKEKTGATNVVSVTRPLANPADFLGSVVRLTRYLTKEEMLPNQPNVTGFFGTAWFLHSQRHLVTIAHVVEYPTLSRQEWDTFEVSRIGKTGEEEIRKVRLRLFETIKCPGEDIVVLELMAPPFADVTPLELRTTPFPEKSPIFCLGYSNGGLRTAVGSFYGVADHTEDDGRRLGFGLFEMFEDNDRLVIDHGASGAPIFDDSGQVVAVASTVINQTIKILDQEIRTSSSWGNPTNLGVVILTEKLKECFSK